MRYGKRLRDRSGGSPETVDREEILMLLRIAIAADEAEWAETATARSAFSEGIAAGEPADAWEAYRRYSERLRGLGQSNRATWDALSLALDPTRELTHPLNR